MPTSVTRQQLAHCGAIDLRFNLLAETAQTAIRVPVILQIGPETGILASLLLFQAADLDQICKHSLE